MSQKSLFPHLEEPVQLILHGCQILMSVQQHGVGKKRSKPSNLQALLVVNVIKLFLGEIGEKNLEFPKTIFVGKLKKRFKIKIGTNLLRLNH